MFHRVMSIKFHKCLNCKFGTTWGWAVHEKVSLYGLGGLKIILSKFFIVYIILVPLKGLGGASCLLAGIWAKNVSSH